MAAPKQFAIGAQPSLSGLMIKPKFPKPKVIVELVNYYGYGEQVQLYHLSQFVKKEKKMWNWKVNNGGI